MAANKENIRRYAKSLYVEKGWKQNAISKFIEVPEKTITAWKKKAEGTAEDWDAERTRFITSPAKIKTALIAEIEKLLDGKEPTVNADALSKLYKVLTGMNLEITPEIVAAVFEGFDLFAVNEFPQEAVRVSEMHRKFLLYKINNVKNG